MPETIKPDREFLEKVLATPEGKKLARCYACGTCSSGCPVHEKHPEFNPRKIIRMILLGRKDEIFDSGVLWLCSTCFTCRERCPQEVGCAEIITVLRNMAVAEGRAPEAYKAQLEAIAKTGRVYEIEDFDNKKRGKFGLGELKTKSDVSALFENSGKETESEE